MPDDAAPLIRTIVCPACWELPSMVIGPTQALCATPDCSGIIFSPSADPAQAKANTAYIDLSPIETEPGVYQGTATATRPQTPMDLPFRSPPDWEARRRDPEWAEQESGTRMLLHAQGARCADGCVWCDPELPLTKGQRTHIAQTVTDVLETMPRPFTTEVFMERIRPVTALYGVRGAQFAGHVLKRIAGQL